MEAPSPLSSIRLCRRRQESVKWTPPVVWAAALDEQRLILSDSRGALRIVGGQDQDEYYEVLLRGDASSAEGIAVDLAWIGFGFLREQREIVVGSSSEVLAFRLAELVDDASPGRRLIVAEDDSLSCVCVEDVVVAAGDEGGGLLSGDRRVQAHDSRTTTLAWSRGGFVLSGASGSVKVWMDMQCVQELRIGLCRPTRLVPVSGDACSFLAVADEAGGLSVWTTQPKLVSIHDDTAAKIIAATFVSEKLVVADADGVTRVYALDLATGNAELETTFHSRDSAIAAIVGTRAVHTDGRVMPIFSPSAVDEEEDEACLAVGGETEEVFLSEDEEEDAAVEIIREEEEVEVQEPEEPAPRVVIPRASPRPDPPDTTLVRPSRVDALSTFAVATPSTCDAQNARAEASRAKLAEADLEHSRARFDMAVRDAQKEESKEERASGPSPALLDRAEPVRLPPRKRLVPKQVDPSWLHRLDALKPQPEDFAIPDSGYPQARMSNEFKLSSAPLKTMQTTKVSGGGGGGGGKRHYNSSVVHAAPLLRCETRSLVYF